MPSHPSFPAFEKELNRLVATFENNFAHYKKPGYDEASLRQEFLNPLFSALGWDVENKAGHIPQKREVEVRPEFDRRGMLSPERANAST